MIDRPRPPQGARGVFSDSFSVPPLGLGSATNHFERPLTTIEPTASLTTHSHLGYDNFRL